MSPWLVEACAKIHHHGGGIDMNTNGVGTLRKYLDLAQYTRFFCFSYHPQYHDNSWFDKVAAVAEKTQIEVRVMIPARQDLWDRSRAVYEKLITNPRNFSVQLCQVGPMQDWSTITPEGQQVFLYTPEQLEYLAKPMVASVAQTRIAFGPDHPSNNWQVAPHPGPEWVNGDDAYYLFDCAPAQVHEFFKSSRFTADMLVNSNMIDFTGWSCDIGLEELAIQTNGAVYAGNCCVGMPMGWIQNSEQIVWPTSSYICDKSNPNSLCTCGTDIRMSKRVIPLVHSRQRA